MKIALRPFCVERMPTYCRFVFEPARAREVRKDDLHALEDLRVARAEADEVNHEDPGVDPRQVEGEAAPRAADVRRLRLDFLFYPKAAFQRSETGAAIVCSSLIVQHSI